MLITDELGRHGVEVQYLATLEVVP
jgi:hypothetical protein